MVQRYDLNKHVGNGKAQKRMEEGNNDVYDGKKRTGFCKSRTLGGHTGQLFCKIWDGRSLVGVKMSDDFFSLLKVQLCNITNFSPDF